ncbi:hypothetical protein SAMN04488020_102122 [Palleronia marisminoris]|uniref:Peptidase M23 n=1 Tax=Palleronia marisminoris TaxID=315423 RepID=A0A1Y5RZY7_9RHOB|nr:hypothetical protein [Palleronia marisminoris]SFG40388.1 hypothetical protein SAMN04488020_102122 [Palleronia marisminoris]SLN28856.1 hypothetical protein PAM7066_01158 [Palleronia marisminoris]
MRALPVLMLFALPAAAHDGAHLHPHGSGSWLIVVLALGLVAAVGLAGGRILFRRSDRDPE